jgi:hypothetical protein
MPISILKQTETIAVVKVFGAGGTINLSTDLLSPTMIIQGTPTVNIIFAQWNISPGAADVISVTRNGISVLNLHQNAGELDLSGNGGYADTTGNTFPLVVTITGLGEAYFTLRKASGYKSRIEPETFSSYDNTSVVGS